MSGDSCQGSCWQVVNIVIIRLHDDRADELIALLEEYIRICSEDDEQQVIADQKRDEFVRTCVPRMQSSEI